MFAAYVGMSSDSTIRDNTVNLEADFDIVNDYEAMRSTRDGVGYGAALNRRYDRPIDSDGIVVEPAPKFQGARAIG
eukprot:186687-Pyramimonas_sp.AAC.1